MPVRSSAERRSLALTRLHAMAALLGVGLSLMTSAGAANTVLSGKTDYPTLGLSFTIPEGWHGQQSEAGLVLGSETEAGFMLMNQHPYDSIEALQQAADQGIHDVGITLTRDSEIRIEGDDKAGASYAGVFEGQPARAYVVGVLNTYGAGISILALTSKEAWNGQLAERAWQIAHSLTFEKPDNSAQIAQWQSHLSNVRLTFMDSDYSSGASVDGYSTYSSHSTTKVLHLCAEGHYKYGSSSSLSFDSGGGFGHGGGSDQGHGRWKVRGNAAGQPVLHLNGIQGGEFEFVLDSQAGKTFLDGERYFRTLPGDTNGYGPDCP